jgi:small subunit ribosomal protein S15
LARIHSHRHGKSQSTRPTGSGVPGWVTYTPDEVKSFIVKMAKEGLTRSQIGTVLRDDYGIPLTRALLGASVDDVLRENKLSPKIPEDLQNLLDKAQRVQKHLAANKSDRRNVRSLELIEAKAYRLSKYYKGIGALPSDFKFTALVAQLA